MHVCVKRESLPVCVLCGRMRPKPQVLRFVSCFDHDCKASSLPTCGTPKPGFKMCLQVCTIDQCLPWILASIYMHVSPRDLVSGDMGSVSPACGDWISYESTIRRAEQELRGCFTKVCRDDMRNPVIPKIK